MKRTLNKVKTRYRKRKLTEAEKREKWMKDVTFNALRAEQTKHFQLIGNCETPEELEHLLMCAELEGKIVKHIFDSVPDEVPLLDNWWDPPWERNYK